MSRTRPLRLVWVYPDLLSTYGDRGNALVLERRARLRGLPVEIIEVNSDQPVPRDGDIYLMGGVQALRLLDIRSGRGERRAVGEIVADVEPELNVGRLTGFENHQGVTRLGGGVRPLARTEVGTGNGDGTEGPYAGRVLGPPPPGPAPGRGTGQAPPRRAPRRRPACLVPH